MDRPSSDLEPRVVPWYQPSLRQTKRRLVASDHSVREVIVSLLYWITTITITKTITKLKIIIIFCSTGVVPVQLFDTGNVKVEFYFFSFFLILKINPYRSTQTVKSPHLPTSSLRTTARSRSLHCPLFSNSELCEKTLPKLTYFEQCFQHHNVLYRHAYWLAIRQGMTHGIGGQDTGQGMSHRDYPWQFQADNFPFDINHCTMCFMLAGNYEEEIQLKGTISTIADLFVTFSFLLVNPSGQWYRSADHKGLDNFAYFPNTFHASKL